VVARTHDAGDGHGKHDKAGDELVGEKRHTPFQGQEPQSR
jgi:hypothetical protein